MNIFNNTLFAVNREDHLIESQVIKKIKPEKMLMIGSGGCIALSLKVIFPKLDLSIVDINSHQISHINKKIKAVKSQNFEELNVNVKNDFCLNQNGGFDRMFQQLRDLFIYYVAEDIDIIKFFDSETYDNERDKILVKWLSNDNISLPFQKTFNEERIFKTFGNEATKHGDFGSYPQYMEDKIISGLKKRKSYKNPFLQHIFLGYYKSLHAFPYINEKEKIKSPKIISGSVLDVKNISSYQIVSLSNIFDWSSESLVKNHAAFLSQLKKGSAIIIRQINNHKNWIDIFSPWFEEDSDFDNYWQKHDRSMFYDHIRLFVRI